MKRRLTTFVLAAFYLLQATWLLHAGMDLLLPTVRETAAAAGDSCCNNACGCPEDVKSVYGCCCAPEKKTTEAPAKKPSTPSFLEAARCKGVEAALTQAFTQPVVCAFAFLAPAPAGFSPVSFPEAHPVLPPSGLATDKVPIA